MKKIFTYILFTFLTIFFCIPLFLSVSNAIMNMDEMMDMGQENCIEHCLSADIYFQDSPFTSLFYEVSEIIQKILFFYVFSFESKDYFLTLALFFGLHLLAPPGLYYKLKNQDFVSLIGIIKSST